MVTAEQGSPGSSGFARPVLSTKQPVPVDLGSWPRRQHFDFYLNTTPCTYAITVHIDVTRFVETLRCTPWSAYVSQGWVLATVVNRYDEFRMTLLESRQPGIWPEVHPSFTVLNPAQDTFAVVAVPYDPDFAAFHERAAALMDTARGTTEMFPQGPLLPNVFDISSVPWAHFTGFQLNIRDGWDHFAPIFTIGKYARDAEKTVMPLAVQIHHAVADGFHVARMINEVQKLFTTPDWLLKE